MGEVSTEPEGSFRESERMTVSSMLLSSPPR